MACAERDSMCIERPESDEAKQAVAEAAIKAAAKTSIPVEERAALQRQRMERRSAAYSFYIDQCNQNCSIAIDLSFTRLMTLKEQKSLVQQLLIAYGAIKKSPLPCWFHLCACDSGSRVESGIRALAGLNKWRGFKFHPTDQPLEECRWFPSENKAGEDSSRIVYLTADSPHTLTTLDAGTVYVIGGLVDRNRHPRITLDKAERLGLSHAKLPIADVVDAKRLLVLTVNHVVQIMAHWLAYQNWERAVLEVMPARKEGKVFTRRADGGAKDDLDAELVDSKEEASE